MTKTARRDAASGMGSPRKRRFPTTGTRVEPPVRGSVKLLLCANPDDALVETVGVETFPTELHVCKFGRLVSPSPS